MENNGNFGDKFHPNDYKLFTSCITIRCNANEFSCYFYLISLILLYLMLPMNFQAKAGF